MLHVETLGDGPELVLIHGWSMHGDVCRGLAERLAPCFRVHLPDLPGHGRSRGLAFPDLRELAVALGDRFPEARRVCGWSLGAQVALRWALDRPQQVARLALISATPRFAAADRWDVGTTMGSLEAFAHELHKDYPGTLDRFIALQAAGSGSPRAVLAAFRERLASAQRPDPEALDAGLAILAENDMRDEAQNIIQPTLVIHGELDAVTPWRAGAWLAQALPHGKFMLIEGAGHAPFVSHEAECAHALSQHFHD